MSYISTATGVLGLASAGIGIAQAFRGDQDLEDAQKAAGRQAGISTEAQQFALDVAKGIVDPRDPRYQALIAESRQADFANLLMGHQQQAIEARRHVARGGQSTVSDRDDAKRQTEFRALDYPGVANERRNAARAALLAAGNAAGIGISGSNVSGNLAFQNEALRGDQLEGDIRLLGESAGQIDRSWEDLFGNDLGKVRGPGSASQRNAGRNDPK